MLDGAIHLDLKDPNLVSLVGWWLRFDASQFTGSQALSRLSIKVTQDQCRCVNFGLRRRMRGLVVLISFNNRTPIISPLLGVVFFICAENLLLDLG